jgi:glycosyltransferase involved in cell wall biosynthesis
MPAPASVSVVIPALDAERTLGPTLASLEEGRRSGLVGDVIVVDGFSRDRTRDIAAASGAIVVEAPRGRGLQLAAGAERASGDWLLFLHADTVLEAGWVQALTEYPSLSSCPGLTRASTGFSSVPDVRAQEWLTTIGTETNQREPVDARVKPGHDGEERGAAERAFYFRFRLDDPSPAARRVERLVAWRCRMLALPYGDQGLLIPAAFYRALGGYRPLPLMEDVDFIRRIGRSRLVELPVAATTSAARYGAGGYWRRPLRNLFCLACWFAGVPPRLILRLYA